MVTRLGTKVDPRTAVIRVDGQAAAAGLADTSTWCSTSRAAWSRRCPTPRAGARSPDLVGRPARSGCSTSAASTPTPRGCCILTNDGDFAQRLAHPSYEVDKTYVAEVDGDVSARHARAAAGRASTLDDGPVTVSAARLVRRGGRTSSIVELVIHEGRNRIVRRLLDHVGHPVRQLTRTAIGPVAARAS